MKWRLTVYLRDGSSTSVFYSSRRYAREDLQAIVETMVDRDSYWFETKDSSYLIRHEEFWGAEISKVESL